MRGLNEPLIYRQEKPYTSRIPRQNDSFKMYLKQNRTMQTNISTNKNNVQS